MAENRNIRSDNRLHYHPLKDTLVILFSCLTVASIVLISLFTRPVSQNSYVEIKYGNVLLWDKDDESKETRISFPETGNKVLTYLRSDGPLFLGEGKFFDFYSTNEEEPTVQVTIYADKSIQITKQESPRNVCAKMDRVYFEYTPLVCLPNSFQAVIKSDSGFPQWDN
ncbi:MAG: hypothetical protein WCR67_03805 [Bacilli bacterium]